MAPKQAGSPAQIEVVEYSLYLIPQGDWISEASIQEKFTPTTEQNVSDFITGALCK